jgi:hypothetical protein
MIGVIRALTLRLFLYDIFSQLRPADDSAGRGRRYKKYEIGLFNV